VLKKLIYGFGKGNNMKIVIVGNGKIGFSLSHQLSKEGHDIVIIDSKNSALRHSMDTQDVFCIEGNGVSKSVQIEAGVPNADLLIAVTSFDEINIICCLIAKKLGAKHTIARVRDPEYVRDLNFIRDELGLSMSINPELAAAQEIARILRFPSAMKVDFFANNKVELIEYRIGEQCPLAGKALYTLPGTFHVKILICAVQRNNQVIIPDGNFVLEVGDRISITSSPKEITAFFHAIGMVKQKIKSVIIVGGGRISYYLALQLLEMKMSVKILELNEERCQTLAELLPKAMVLHADGSDQEVLMEEGIADTDAVVALTGLDEENVVISMFAASENVSKVITKINHLTLGTFLERAGIDCAITPNIIAANRIVHYVRAMQNSLGSNVEAMTKVVDNKVEALEFRVREKFRGKNIPLKDISLKKGLLIASIIRGGRLIFPGGNDSIQVRDNVIVVTTRDGLQDLNDILQ